MRKLRAIIIIASLLALLCLHACTTVHSQFECRSQDNLNSNDNIVLLSNLEGNQDFDDNDVVKCIRPAMHKVNPDLNFISAKEFREKLYPYFTPSYTPHDLDGYKNILDKPEVLQRINSLGVRYLIILTRGGSVNNWHGGILCGAGYGGGGCFGLSWWNRKSELDLAIWDLSNKSLEGNVRADATGTGIMPAFGLPIPVYMPATEAAVCEELGIRLGKLLSGQEKSD
jgi:hypothetical protein